MDKALPHGFENPICEKVEGNGTEVISGLTRLISKHEMQEIQSKIIFYIFMLTVECFSSTLDF